MSTPSRAVLYLRLSSTTEDSTSIARQEADLRKLAASRGWEVTRVLVDDGISGRKARANADEALRMIREGEADVLAVVALDRFTRQGIGAVGRLVEALDAAPSARFVTLRDGLDSTSPAWRLIASVLSEVARTEAENTATRARSAIEYRKTVTHRFTGGTIPYGYDSAPADGPGRVLAPNPAEREIVREVADRLLADEAPHRIALDLNRRGVPTAKSPRRKARYRGEPDDNLPTGRWTAQTIRDLWTSHTIAGRVSHGTDVVRDEHGIPVTAWEPLLDPDTLVRLLTRLAPTTPQTRRRRAARVLSGLVYCAYCDRKMHVTHSSGGPAYVCSSRANGFECVSPQMQAEGLESIIVDRFLTAFGASAEVEVRQVVEGGVEEAALADVEGALRDTLATLAADNVDAVAVLARVDVLKARRAELRAVPSSVRTETSPTGRTLREAWHASESVDYRRTVLLQALDHLTVSSSVHGRRLDPERVRIHWNS